MKKLFICICFVLLAGATGCRQAEDDLLDEVNKAIAIFIENYSEDYVNEEKLDYYVVPALSALDDINLEDYVNKETVEVYLDQLEYTEINDAFVAAVNSKAFSIEINDKAVESLKGFEEISPFSYNYGLIALNIENVNQSLRDNLLGKINIIREEDFRDADYAGIALMASADYDIDHNPLFELIDKNLTADGVVSWGNANASSTANSILGLIAMGIDPTSEAYTTNEVNLVEALLKYENDGAFAYILGEEHDLAFATPQAFSALVAYKVFVESEKAFNLFA